MGYDCSTPDLLQQIKGSLSHWAKEHGLYRPYEGSSCSVISFPTAEAVSYDLGPSGAMKSADPHPFIFIARFSFGKWRGCAGNLPAGRPDRAIEWGSFAKGDRP